MSAPDLRNQTQAPSHDGRPATVTEYLELPDDGRRYELIQGVLRLSPSPFRPHGTVAGRFFRVLDTYLDEHPVGTAGMECDVILETGDVLRPDVHFASGPPIRGHIRRVPELVAEVLSASTAERDRELKGRIYLHAGVREFWLIDPDKHTLEVRYHDEGTWQVNRGDELESRVLPGLVVTVRQLFKE